MHFKIWLVSSLETMCYGESTHTILCLETNTTFNILAYSAEGTTAVISGHFGIYTSFVYNLYKIQYEKWFKDFGVFP